MVFDINKGVPMSRYKYYRRRKNKKSDIAIFFTIIFLLLMIGLIMQFPVIGWILLIIPVAIFILYLSRKIYVYTRSQMLTGKLEDSLMKALELMDSSAPTYSNEEEANKELVTVLKALGLDATYQYPLGNGYRYADVKVGNAIIEGKLNPHQGDIDRLLGQIHGYSEYPYQLYIVIYGYLGNYSRKRISEFINTHYPGKVFLTYLTNPKRKRVNSYYRSYY